MTLRTRFFLIVSLVGLAAFGAVLCLAASFQQRLVISQAERQARMLSRQILLTSRWVADHDGLFVIRKSAEENTTIPTGGDVVDKSGRVYVKRNPGMVIWDLSDYSGQEDFCRFRVTSLRPINPNNAPDSFERQGLLDFETGRQEASEIVNGAQGRILRYIIPLKVEKSCLPCHAEHGYQLGNIRGGLSLEVPLEWADKAIAANNVQLLLAGLAAAVLVGLAAFLMVDSLVGRRLGMLAAGLDRSPRTPPSDSLPGGDDEVGALTGKIVAMIERLEKSQAELASIREQLAESEREAAVEQMAENVANEINVSLGQVRNSLKTIREGRGGGEGGDPELEALDREVSRLGQVVRQLRVVRREAPPELGEIEIDRLVRHCFDLLAGHFHGVRLDLDLAVTGSRRLDGRLLEQVLVNVAMSAMQALPRGGELHVRSREESGAVVISVRDNGPGVPPAELDRIAESAGAGDADRGRRVKFALSDLLVKRLGGKLRVESRPGEGSTYTIELPAAGS